MISSRVEPWICGPSAVRGRLPRRYLMMNAISAPSTSEEDDAGEDRDEDERVVDAVRVRRMRLAGQEPTVARVARRSPSRARRRLWRVWQARSGARGWHRIERGSAESGRAARRRRRPVRGLRERRRAAAGRRLRPGRPHARLPARARAGGPARLLALAVALPRCRRAPTAGTTPSTSSTRPAAAGVVASLAARPAAQPE